MMQSTDNVTLNRLLTTVARQGASDLHLTVGTPPVLRKDGQLFQLEREEVVTSNFIERVFESFLNETDKRILDEHHEVTVTYTFNKVLRFRVHIYKQKGSYALAFRYIPFLQKKIHDLRLPPYLEKVVRYRAGLVIVGGIYDCGKSTTVASIINTVNELGPPRYITTLEKPLEHIFASNVCIIEQREVGKDVSSYVQGLSLIVEQDVDMVVIDTLEDEPSTKKMFEVLEAGRLVILTTEASNSYTALIKVLSFLHEQDYLWARRVLVDRLQCLLMQKLVHKIGGGRTLAYEFLVNTGIVQSIISSGNFSRLESVFRTNQEYDITSIEATLAALVRKGEITLDTALAEANDRNYLQSLLRK